MLSFGLKAGVHFRNFSMDRKNNFSETRKYFPRVGKNFRRAEKFDIVLAKHAVSEGTKAMKNISSVRALEL